MFLLDTNIVSELRKAANGKANPGVIQWTEAKAADSFFISAITLLELEKGVRLKELSDPASGAVLRAWLEAHVVPAFMGRILPVDEKVSRLCAAMHVPSPRPMADSLIAATAQAHDFMLVTRNIKDFEGLGIRLFNPWQDLKP